MYRHFCVLLFTAFFCKSVQAQSDTSNLNQLSADIDYDELFSELDNFLDSITKPRSYALFNVGMGSRVFNFQSESDVLLNASKNFSVLPSLGYFHKSGFGLNAAATILKEPEGFNAFQFSTTASYDYLKNRDFITGISFTHFFTKDSLNFYTSPLANEAYVYFSIRKSWIKPTLSASYGWGTRTSYEEREEQIRLLRLRRNGVTRIETTESIHDFNINLSIRHDFYWLNVLSAKDFIRLTPQLSLTSGTQKFGFNQNSNSYATYKLTRSNVLYNSENVSLSDKMSFQPLSVTAFLKSEFSKGKFFFQPQVIFDYYIPASEQKFTTTFLLNTGLMF